MSKLRVKWFGNGLTNTSTVKCLFCTIFFAALQYRPRYRSSIAARMACPGNVSGKFCYRPGATCKTKQMRHSPLVHTPNSHTEYTRTRTHSSVASFRQWCAVVCRHSIIWNSNIEIPKKFLISIKLFANARTNTLHTHTYTQPHCLPHSATTIDVCVFVYVWERLRGSEFVRSSARKVEGKDWTGPGIGTDDSTASSKRSCVWRMM